MAKQRTEAELREVKQRTRQIKRFYQAWYRNYPHQKPKNDPATDTDYDKWLSRLMRRSNYSAVNNARMGNLPLGRSCVEKLHQRLRDRLYDEQRGVRLWCLHWLVEDRSPRPKTLTNGSARNVSLRSPVDEIIIHTTAAQAATSLRVLGSENIRGGGKRFRLAVSYRRKTPS